MWTFITRCGDLSASGKIVLFGDLSIAFAYFAIPVGLLIVMRHRLHDIPYPWMVGLFAAFITACGLTHLVHAVQMPLTLEHTTLEATIKAITALLSIGTAGALIGLMPQLKKVVSPAVARSMLEDEIKRRTRETDALVREINHQMGNMLQIAGAALRIEMRKQPDDPALARLNAVLDDLTDRYTELRPRYQRLQSKEMPPEYNYFLTEEERT